MTGRGDEASLSHPQWHLVCVSVFLSWLVLGHFMHCSRGGIYRRRSEIQSELAAIYLQLQHPDLFILQSPPGRSAITVEIQPWVNHFLEAVGLH